MATMAQLDVAEVCKALGISRMTVYSLIRRGLLTKHTRAFGRGVGGARVFFDSEQVKRLKGLERTPDAMPKRAPGKSRRKVAPSKSRRK